MTPADIVALAAFFTILIAGLLLRTLRQMLRQRPAARVKSRLASLREPRGRGRPDREDMERRQLVRPTFDVPEQAALAALAAWRERVHTVSGASGLRLIAFAAVAAFAAALIAASLLSLPPLLGVAVAVVAMLVAVRSTYGWLVARFRQRFLAHFPDALDLIIRAVRAGIPVVQAICTAGAEGEEPVRGTFRTMGDALLVGADLKEVLQSSARRLQLADFSFFSVCLVLQRETGGNLGDTLENLASIVRSRRDIRAKSKALTAEGRLASKMIAAVPFVLMAFMYLMNPSYLRTLTSTPTGHQILATAAVLMTVGLWMISKIANLDTSR